MTLFDNAGMYGVYDEDTARGLVLGLDFENMKASLVQQYVPFSPAVSESQGSMQLQPNGNALVGWGQNPWLAEYTSSGELLWTAQFGVNNVQNYRALRYNWTGTPNTSPSVEMIRGRTSILSFYASWNGATEITKWEILGATDADGSGTVSLYNRTKAGFETAITIGANNLEKYSHFAVRAINRQNQPLGRSEFQQPSSASRSRVGRIGMCLLAVAVGWILPSSF
ncbi:hypothetical protein AAF712_010761 [Marasmius tenuissimus]|uniref:Uncharacterized protein n=1 Tax=Marasmius tenuissimus TaxID=585030 RepID=A0ABR2ZM18_9AGAR